MEQSDRSQYLYYDKARYHDQSTGIEVNNNTYYASVMEAPYTLYGSSI